MTSPPSTLREYDVSAQSTATFGRVLCQARNHHFISDGPVQNGCPGEELTPPELFLSSVAACGVELVHVIAKEQKVAVDHVSVAIHATLDRAKQPRPDVTLFNSVQLDFRVRGTEGAKAAALVEAFKKR